MWRRSIIFGSFIIGAILIFIAGFVAGGVVDQVLGPPLKRTPAATISLDLSDQVQSLQQERARLKLELAEKVARIEALENRRAGSQANGPNQATNDQSEGANRSSVSQSSSVSDGAKAYEAGDYSSAFKIWRPLAESGDPSAQFHLGALYYEGRGVERDLKKARNWLSMAAEGGSAAAISLLAIVEEEIPSTQKEPVSLRSESAKP